MSVKDLRFKGLSEQIDRLLWQYHDKGKLSSEQQRQLKECGETISCFGELGDEYYKEVVDVLNEINYGKDNKETIKTMANKTYVIVCSCNGTNLKVFENLDYYRMLTQRNKRNLKNLFKK